MDFCIKFKFDEGKKKDEEKIRLWFIKLGNKGITFELIIKLISFGHRLTNYTGCYLWDSFLVEPWGCYKFLSSDWTNPRDMSDNW